MARLTARDWETLRDRYHARNERRREECRMEDPPATDAQVAKVRALRAALGEDEGEPLPETCGEASRQLDRLKAHAGERGQDATARTPEGRFRGGTPGT